jgi:hypothetical protein
LTQSRCSYVSNTGIEYLEGRTLFASFSPVDVVGLVRAINAANLSPGADTITLRAGATYSLHAVDHTDTIGPTGLPAIKAGGITIVGNGAIIERSAAANTPAFRLLQVTTGAKLTLQNLTLQGGMAIGDVFGFAPTLTTPFVPAPAQGGAIFSRGTLTMNTVIVRKNTAMAADAVLFYGPRVLGPTAAEGGGVYSTGTITMTGCKIDHNSAIGGRGIDAYDFPSPYDNAGGRNFRHGGSLGSNGSGGGIYIANGQASLTSTTFTANIARGGNGGAGYAFNGGLPSGGGGSGFGGGLYAAVGTITLHSVSASGNLASGGAAGVSFVNKYNGVAGQGKGGGFYFSARAHALLDPFTIQNVTANSASSSAKDIFGLYTRQVV